MEKIEIGVILNLVNMYWGNCIKNIHFLDSLRNLCSRIFFFRLLICIKRTKYLRPNSVYHDLFNGIFSVPSKPLSQILRQIRLSCNLLFQSNHFSNIRLPSFSCIFKNTWNFINSTLHIVLSSRYSDGISRKKVNWNSCVYNYFISYSSWHRIFNNKFHKYSYFFKYLYNQSTQWGVCKLNFCWSYENQFERHSLVIV